MAANSAENGLDFAQVKRENDSGDVIILEDDSETVAMPNNNSDDNLSQQSTQEHVEHTAKIETSGPIEQAVAHLFINAEDNGVPALPKTEPSINISTTPKPRNFINSSEETNFSNQSIPHKRRRLQYNISNDAIENTKKRSASFNSTSTTVTQTICSHCRTILNESEIKPHISAKHLNYFPFECATCKETNQKHLAVSKEDMDLHMSTHHNGNNLGIILLEDGAKEVELDKMIDQCQRLPMLQTSSTANSVERPTTSAIITTTVPADPSCKETLTKLFIVLSEGIVCFENTERLKYDYAPLGDYLPILRESILIKDRCDIVFQFYASDSTIPYLYQKSSDQAVMEFASLKQLQTFAQQLRSIASLWADSPISVHFGRFKKARNETLSQSDYCNELFNQERSILKCKELSAIIVDNWPLSIITNVVGQCEDSDLYLEEVSSGNLELHDAFLDEIYEREVLQRTPTTLFISTDSALRDFIAKLKERFRRTPQKRFKFELLFYSTTFHKLSLQTQGSTLEAKLVKKVTKSHNQLSSGRAIIEQRAIDS